MLKTIEKWYIFLCVILLCVFCAAVSPPAPAEAPVPTYVLSVYRGHIALFFANKNQPIEVYDVKITSLPEADAERLVYGIPAADENELQRLLEDYCS